MRRTDEANCNCWKRLALSSGDVGRGIGVASLLQVPVQSHLLDPNYPRTSLSMIQRSA